MARSDEIEQILHGVEPPPRPIVSVKPHYYIPEPTKVAFWIAKLSCNHERVAYPHREEEPKVGELRSCTATGCILEVARPALDVWEAIIGRAE